MDQAQILNSLPRIEGDVLRDTWQRYMYASDASSYEIVPICVILPKNVEDVIRIVKFAYEHDVPIIPRGGGSGLAGQAIGDGIVLDFTKYMNKILEINEDESYVKVEPGLYKGILDKELKSLGKSLPPDPSSANYCALGGMVATNASGAHTVKYGSTIDYILSLDVVLSNGELITTQPIKIDGVVWQEKSGTTEGELLKSLAQILSDKQQLIEENFPKVSKNSCGYRIDKVMHDGFIDMGKLFAGSEGTLGVVVGANFRIMNLPQEKALMLLGFSDTLKASESVVHILDLQPSALELIDRTVVQLARNASDEFSSKVPTETNCLLFVEFDGNVREEVDNAMRKLSQIAESVNARVISYSYDEVEISKLWQIRKNALSYTMKIREGRRKPIAFMEDPVVSPDKLGFLVDTLQRIYEKHGLSYVIYGHAGDGNLHTRPLLDLGNEGDIEKMREITYDVLDAITSVSGSISAEHGDGVARSEFIQEIYGEEVYDIFVKIKQLFDPSNILNPNKKVAQKGTFLKNFRYGYDRRPVENRLNWQLEDSRVQNRITGYDRELNYDDEIELCHGCGGCRDLNMAWRMCPVYKGLNNEVASCRGRNNVLRWLTKVEGLAHDFSLTEEYKDIIYKYCVQCKMCLVDCPSNVNVGKSMAEARAAYAKQMGLPKGYKFFIDIDKHAALGCKLSPLSNLLMGNGLFRKILEKATGIDARKRFPKFSKRTFDDLFASYSDSSGLLDKQVVFFCDTYIRYIDPHLGMRIVKMLERNGYNTIFPAQMSSGLPALLEGAPERGREIARYNVESLYEYAKDGVPIVCFSPSSSIALKMDYLSVLDDEKTRTVANNTYDIHEFLISLYDRGELDTDFQPVGEGEGDDVGVHFHCHTIVQGADKHVRRLLNLIPGLKYHVVEKGCCGVGGSYSFIKENYDMAMQIGKALFDAAGSEEHMYTTGESCRLQIMEGCRSNNRHIGLTVDLIARAYGIT